MPLPLVIYGRESCQDTQLVRDRLRALHVPSTERDVERDAGAAERVKAWNHGSLSTPTLVFGDEERVVAEPALDRVDELARWAGHEVCPPAGIQLHGDVAARSLPSQTLQDAAGGTVSIAALRERSQAVLFFPHPTDCLACRSYAHALLSAETRLAETGSVAYAVAPAPKPAVTAWLDGEATLPAPRVLADEGGGWRRRAAAFVPQVGTARADEPFVLILDRWQAPRIASVAAEAGGLVSHAEIWEWLAWLSQECGECTIELPWDEAGR